VHITATYSTAYFHTTDTCSSAIETVQQRYAVSHPIINRPPFAVISNAIFVRVHTFDRILGDLVAQDNVVTTILKLISRFLAWLIAKFEGAI
jgi:hypothetical protein